MVYKLNIFCKLLARVTDTCNDLKKRLHYENNIKYFTFKISLKWNNITFSTLYF